MEFNNNKSIYLQIAESITEKIVRGEYAEGNKIPSVREMAANMGVNPNTIMRTYSELQSQGIIGNKRGIGYFVNEKAQEAILLQKRKHFYEEVLPEFIRQAELLGIELEDLQKHLSTLENENK
ncbi:GntR family transcriptional regulator [Algivirga pacifica]|uniref:GntR family transcriptional regulator n=1 Tax=Algivirga pacifica TaxID=1162670 RepID=A0ABP9D8U6_9BACT